MEGLLEFYSECKERRDKEVIEAICNDLSLQLYVDSTHATVNYMISGSIFVIDLVYKKTNFVSKGTEDKGQDSASICSVNSITNNTGEYKEEEVYVIDGLEDVLLSFVEEDWGKHFFILPSFLFHCLVEKRYLRLYRMLANFVRSDSIEGIRAITEKVKKEGTKDRQCLVSYCFGEERVVAAVDRRGVFDYKDKSIVVVELRGGKIFFFGKEVKGMESVRAKRAEVLLESYLLNIPVRIKGRSVVYKNIEIMEDCTVKVGGEVDEEMSIILKKRRSLCMVIGLLERSAVPRVFEVVE